MYLHRLELRAIGPYPGLVTIDFAALAASGVFLLEGPTGAGKSTIIDAVVFALYGGLAGEGSTHDRLHSQHADPGVEPFVELVFETGAGVYRVRRTPQYDRPKQRGTGTVRQQASAQLFRLAHPADAVGEPVSSRIPEIGLEVTRAIGLDRAQFLQTVVLPQGEFARFLRSPGEDRRKLLQSLFGTQVYDRTADELAARRREVQAEVEAADARVRDALSRFAQAAGVDDPDEGTVPATVEVLRAAAAETAAQRADAVAALDRARAHEQDVVARLTARTRRAALLDRRRALDDGAARIAAARDRLAVADRAARVTTSADGLDAARTRAAEASGAAADLRRRTGVPDSADLGSRRAELLACAAAVRHLVAVETSLDTRRRALADALDRAEQLAARVAELDAALEARPAERAALVEQARTAAAAAGDGEAARAEVDRLRRLLADLGSRDAATAAVTRAEQVVADRRVRAEERLRTEQTLRARRIAGLAGELGAALAPGDRCPVCGSADHPDVAVPQADHPDAATVDAAAAETRAAEAALADAAAALAVDRAELERLRAAVGDTDAGTLAEQTAAATAREEAAHAAAVRVAEVERLRTAHDEATRALEREHNTVQAGHAVLLATSAADAERLDQDASAVADAVTRAGALAARPWTDDGAGQDRPAPASLRAAVQELDTLVTRAEAVIAADDRAATAAHAVTERTAEVARVLAEQDFDSLGAARAAVLTAEETAALRAEVTVADRERAVVEAGLAEPAVVAAADDTEEPLALDAARAALAAAVEQADVATRAAVSATDRVESATRCAGDLARAVRARDDTSARSRAVVRLADVANGVAAVNPTGITLGTYVLMRRFEDVVAAANDRLRGMLGGRFTLETSDEREAGSRARRTGLALAVHDHTTDTRRAPGSLSGGETFTVSLCLALGLADVVQAEAGGVSLGTLFVDEGFGTLDPETLDDVIGQLARLTAGGRQVGIVSHVEELKQRIPERIAVRRTPEGGSRVTTTV
ncbi:AAA family ATPase [Curtobacterium caseinilyticum]|uniref:Nuclease SbcCD subunit C n=1 Tax=Curtobacterium caseinilyticum TaxID=3055137 RepID=A0ABT7TP14_9MICO|nr:SMC family ATPase [Curtobacterium caseinilyticum]MDM7891342.1 SMC family ATPase [Curtobacterium caseinilyticum]